MTRHRDLEHKAASVGTQTMGHPGPRRRFLRDLRRAVSWHRRKLAMVAAIAAVLTAVSAAAPADPPTLRVVRAAAELPSGGVVGQQDISVSEVAEDALPRGALVDPGAVVGRRVLGPVAEGQVLTQLHLLAGKVGVAPGHLVAPLRVADPEVAALLQPGSVIDVIAADPEGAAATVVARDLKVLAVPPPPSEQANRSAAEGALLLVQVDDKTATLLAQAAATTRISLVMH
jgi:pilus assembly protein CpaB